MASLSTSPVTGFPFCQRARMIFRRYTELNVQGMEGTIQLLPSEPLNGFLIGKDLQYKFSEHLRDEKKQPYKASERDFYVNVRIEKIENVNTFAPERNILLRILEWFLKKCIWMRKKTGSVACPEIQALPSTLFTGMDVGTKKVILWDNIPLSLTCIQHDEKTSFKERMKEIAESANGKQPGYMGQMYFRDLRCKEIDNPEESRTLSTTFAGEYLMLTSEAKMYKIENGQLRNQELDLKDLKDKFLCASERPTITVENNKLKGIVSSEKVFGDAEILIDKGVMVLFVDQTKTVFRVDTSKVIDTASLKINLKADLGSGNTVITGEIYRLVLSAKFLEPPIPKDKND